MHIFLPTTKLGAQKNSPACLLQLVFVTKSILTASPLLPLSHFTHSASDASEHGIRGFDKIPDHSKPDHGAYVNCTRVPLPTCASLRQEDVNVCLHACCRG